MGKRGRARPPGDDAGGGVIPRWSGPAPPKAAPPVREPWGPSNGQWAVPVPPPVAQWAVPLDTDRLHEAIHSTVSRAVAEIAHAEERWSEPDLVKRIVKYVYKAATDPDLLQLPLESMCHEVVHRSMQGYTASCGEAAWFFSIELPPVFCAALWELLVAAGQSHALNPDQLQEIVTMEYEDKLDRILLDKAMWEAASRTFSDEKVQSKVFQAISRSYWPALDDALLPALMQEEMHGGLTPEQETKQIEAFVKKWITDAISRAWVSIEQAEAVLTEDSLIELFFHLIAPFGEEDPFTCMPGALTEGIGRPPSDWPYIAEAVQELLVSWANGEAGGSSRKRRKGASGEADAGMDDPEAEEDYAPKQPPPKLRTTSRVAKAKPEAQDGYINPTGKARARKFKGFVGGPEDDELDGEKDAAEAEAEEAEDAEQAEDAAGEQHAGHPKCTSEEDCIGNPRCQLVQHILNGEPGDLYCEPCWSSFYKRNPTLEGVLLSG